MGNVGQVFGNDRPKRAFCFGRLSIVDQPARIRDERGGA